MKLMLYWEPQVYFMKGKSKLLSNFKPSDSNK